MKPKFAILLALGLYCCGMAVLAQDQPANGNPPADNNQEPSGDAPASDAGMDEVIPSIIFDETPLTDVITMLARQAGINFVFAPDVTEPQQGPDGVELPPPAVSIRFENVTPRNALMAILENHNLQMTEDKKTGISRISRKDPNALEPLITTVIQLEHASPTNLVEAIKTSIDPTRGSVLADYRTSQLVIVSTEAEMESVSNLVERLDIPTRQVLIEGRIIETTINPNSKKGIDWSGTLEAQNFGFGNGITTGTTTTTTPGSSSSSSTTPGGTTTTTTGSGGSSQSTSLTTALGAAGISANTLMGWSPSTAFLNADGVRGVLHFLNTQADSKVVATPRAVTLDNEKARLEVTRGFPIFEVTPSTANTPGSAEITYTNVGTILEVTPRISANSNIFMTVVPEVSNIESKDSQTVAGLVNEANVYATRRIETSVIIPNGNTLVMGGLMSNTERKQHTKIPILGDIPGLGLLFRKDEKDLQRANLIIFITPTIVEDYDFQYTPTDFLRNSLRSEAGATTWVEPGQPDVSAWDSGKPGWKNRKRSKR